LAYDVNKNVLSGIMKGAVKALRVSLVGRNLFTLTRYRGYDPENSSETYNIFDYRFDYFSYPNFRTITGSVEIKF